METLKGQIITLFCINYIYTGKLVSFTEEAVRLENPSIVYETGDFHEKNWKDAQALPGQLFVKQAAIESYGVMK